MAQYIDLPRNLTGVGEAAQINVLFASGSIFDVLQLQPILGRALTVDDEKADHEKVAVLSNACWRERFGSDPKVIGRPLVVDGQPHAIVGVLPPDTRIPFRSRLSEKFDAVIALRVEEDQVGWVGDHNNDALGRLKPGVTPEEARAELDVLQAQVSTLATAQAHEPVTLTSEVQPLTDDIVGAAKRGLLLLFGAIAAVLLIACSNLANLALTRALARQRETAIRSALGASRARLIGRAIAEQVLLAAVGGALGLAIA